LSSLIQKLRKRYGVLKATPLSELEINLDEGTLKITALDKNGVELEAPYFVVSRDHSMVQYWPNERGVTGYLQNLKAIKTTWDEDRASWRKVRDQGIKDVKTLEQEIRELRESAEALQDSVQPEYILAEVLRKINDKRLAFRAAHADAVSAGPIQPANDLRNRLLFSTGVQLPIGAICRSVRDEKKRLIEKFGSVPKFNEWSYDGNTKIVMRWR